ncbi:MAG: RsmE family RNA methyltransferase [Chlamydiales bacterium]
MPKDRFFVDAPFSSNETVELTEQEAHHLTHVMRISSGEIVELVNGRHQLAQAKVLEITKHSVSLLILHFEERPPPPFSITVCQAIPRFNRLDTILEKGTELGMTELILFPGELSEKKQFSPNQWARLKNVAQAAMKQCGRLDLPNIKLSPPLHKWTQSDIVYPAYFGDIRTQAPKWDLVWQPAKAISFFIGPEAGFSEKEHAHLSSLGVIGVKLHDNILRTDTAPIVALSLACHLL